MGTLVRTLIVLLAAGCASAPQPGPAPAPVEQAPPAPPAGTRETTAVAALMESARTDAAAGKLPSAASSLERALRIEPRNPRLWQQLARVRLQQGDFAQAESLAARSNSYAGGDGGLRAEYQRIIEDARSGRR